MEMHSDVVSWGSVHISYRYSFSRRKTISLSVHPDMSVIVKAPEGTSPESIRALVRRRGGWITRAWRDFEHYLPKQPPRRYVSGETHRYLGRQYRLKIERGEIDAVKCLRGYLWITTKSVSRPERVRELLEGWFRARAKIVFNERLLACHQKLSRDRIALPSLTIRKMEKRWGSLSSAGRVTLNVLLIAAPKDCIDYVIIHELCHLKVKHHGARFWRLIERLMPDYDERRQRLNAYSE